MGKYSGRPGELSSVDSLNIPRETFLGRWKWGRCQRETGGEGRKENTAEQTWGWATRDWVELAEEDHVPHLLCEGCFTGDSCGSSRKPFDQRSKAVCLRLPKQAPTSRLLMAKAPPLPRPVPVASSSSGSQAWVLVSTSLSVSITTIHPVILCFLDPNRREKELVLHHGNALHQVRPGDWRWVGDGGRGVAWEPG